MTTAATETAEYTEQLMTVEDLLALPDDGYRYELSRGRLIRVSPSSWIPSTVGMHLGELISAFVRQHRLGHCTNADGGYLLRNTPDSLRAPDVGFVRTDRLPATPPARFFLGPPDLAVEVISPTDAIAEVLRKVADYLESGTLLVWLIDPGTRRALIFTRDGGITPLAADGVLNGADVLPGFAVALGELWL